VPAVVLRLGRPLSRGKPPHGSQPGHRRLHLLHLPPPAGRNDLRRGLVHALHGAVPRPAASRHHREAEPGAAPGWRRRRPRAAPERARAFGGDLPEAGHPGRAGLGLAPAAGPGLPGEHDGGVVVVMPPSAERPGEPDDGRGGRRRLQVPRREPLRVVVVGGGAVVPEEALGVGVLLERVVAVVDAADVGPGELVLADAELGRLRRVAGEDAPCGGGHGGREGERRCLGEGKSSGNRFGSTACGTRV
jgi:hypothetical protein